MSSPIPILVVHGLMVGYCALHLPFFPFVYVVQASAVAVTMTEKIVPWYAKLGLVILWSAFVSLTARQGYDPYGLDILEALVVVSAASLVVALLAAGMNHWANRRLQFQISLSEAFVAITYAAILFQMVRWVPSGDYLHQNSTNYYLAGLMHYCGYGVLVASLYAAILRPMTRPKMEGSLVGVLVIAGFYLVISSPWILGDNRNGTLATKTVECIILGTACVVPLVLVRMIGAMMAEEATEEV